MIYKGYRILNGSSEEINDVMSNIDYSDWNVNEYLLIQNTDDGSEKEMRFDGRQFVGLKLPPSKYIKAKNALQRCALDMLNNPDITICCLLGLPGSGKTKLATQMALYSVKEKGHHSKIVTIRSPLKDSVDIGFLPGDFDDKTDIMFGPIVDQLDGKEFEYDRLKMQGQIETNIPAYIKGRTLNESAIIVDEAEDLTIKELRLVGTRVGSNSTITFCGDYKQSALNNTEDNPLLKMCASLKGHRLFACVSLEEDVRSETSKLFANLKV